MSQVALQQRKLKKQAKDKDRKLQKRLHDIDVATEEKIRKVDRGEHCAISPVFYDVSQSQDSSLHPPDPRPGSSVVVTPDASSHYYSFPSTPSGSQVVVHDYETTQSVKITVPATRSATVTCEPRPVPSLAQLSRFRPEDIPADAIVTPVLPLTDTKLISALDTPLVSTTTALPAYSPVPLLPPTSVSPADPPPWYRQLVADAVSAFRAQLPGLPPVSAAATITSPDEGVDVSSPPDVPVTKAVKPPPKLVKQPKRSVPVDKLSVKGSDGDDTQSVGARSTKRRREDSEALTLTDAKRWAYQNLGQDLLASPPVAAHELEGVVRPTLEKVDKLLVLCSILRKHPLQEARFVLKVLGFMNAIADTIPLGRLHMRPLQLFPVVDVHTTSFSPPLLELGCSRIIFCGGQTSPIFAGANFFTCRKKQRPFAQTALSRDGGHP